MKVNQFQDGETRRQQRNLTTTQKKTNSYTKEGVVVNSFIKEQPCCTNLNDTYDTLVISRHSAMPEQLKENKASSAKNLIPISGIAVGVMGVITAATAFISHNAKVTTKIAEEKWLPTITRNISINDELLQAIYQMVQSPNSKTITAGAGVLTLTAMAFMGKTIFDGVKDVWIKKKEADIQKDLQEKLIDVETQSFGGKIQITRSMLSEKAAELNEYLSDSSHEVFAGFKKHFGFKNPSFGAKAKENKKSDPLNYFLLGAATVGAVVGLGFLSFKNLTKGKKYVQNYLEHNKNIAKEIISSSTAKTKDTDMQNLEGLFQSFNASKDYMKKELKNVNWKENEVDDFVERVWTKIKTSTTKVDRHIGGDGTPKPAFSSFVDDYRAFFYNFLLDTENKQFKALFFGMTGLAAVSYGGKLAGDAIKEVQVKKINAETELNLQRRLVSTELRNFKSKKEAAIQPMMDEFYTQVEKGKPKEQLKTIADNILFEIKNGPPFVYS